MAKRTRKPTPDSPKRNPLPATPSLARVGVSLEDDLLAAFDALWRDKGYPTRSEAIRDLIRKSLVDERWLDAAGEQAGTLTIVYDHHKHGVSRRLLDMQHENHDIIVTTMHVHLDHDNCLEILVIKGDAERVRSLAERLISCRGVKHGALHMATTGKDLP
jgi:CopG family nickel-responsive transcriptional regulator